MISAAHISHRCVGFEAIALEAGWEGRWKAVDAVGDFMVLLFVVADRVGDSSLSLVYGSLDFV